VKRLAKASFLACVAAIGISAAAPPLGTLTVRIGNVRNDRGSMHIDICPQPYFLKDDCPYVANAPARSGTTIVVAHNIPAGRYAVQAFHDENANKKLDRALFGIPKEGVGFSNDAPIKLSPPKWAAAMFAFNGSEQTIVLNMRYFLGASGPAQK
jgi:uncharacterized protein (DUF2141 family)